MSINTVKSIRAKVHGPEGMLSSLEVEGRVLRVKCGLFGWSIGLCGPKINGNPERLDGHELVVHGRDVVMLAEVAEGSPRSYEGIRRVVLAHSNSEGWEGLVFHHQDGRMAKIKARDFAG